MIEVSLPVRELVTALESERIRTPVVACGTGNRRRAAVAAIQAGAKEYIPLPPDPELIAAVIEAVANDTRSFVWRDPAMEKVVKLAEQVARSDARSSSRARAAPARRCWLGTSTRNRPAATSLSCR
jgi:DNA-binding NtrC family response regulator